MEGRGGSTSPAGSSAPMTRGSRSRPWPRAPHPRPRPPRPLHLDTGRSSAAAVATVAQHRLARHRGPALAGG